jgi:hypothetical protein
MWRWVSTKPGMTIIPEASITSASVHARFGPTCDDLVALDQDVAPGEVADLWIHAETVPPLISCGRWGPPRKSMPRVEGSGIDRLGRPGPEDEASGPLVVPLDQLLEVSRPGTG